MNPSLGNNGIKRLQRSPEVECPTSNHLQANLHRSRSLVIVISKQHHLSLTTLPRSLATICQKQYSHYFYIFALRSHQASHASIPASYFRFSNHHSASLSFPLLSVLAPFCNPRYHAKANRHSRLRKSLRHRTPAGLRGLLQSQSANSIPANLWEPRRSASLPLPVR
jgi:hypothetical protein